MKHQPLTKKALTVLMGAVFSVGLGTAGAGVAPPVDPVLLDPATAIGSLKGRAIPEARDSVSNRTLAEGDGIIRSTSAAIALGKALFWDQQVGSDGQACASCHFVAGADNRSRNQLSPGLLRVKNDGLVTPDGDNSYGNSMGKMKSGATAGPGYQLVRRDYPFRLLKHDSDRNSAVKYDTNDVTSSAGSFGGTFTGLTPGHEEDCTLDTHPSFEKGGLRTRKVEPRNTPTVINAAFQPRTFWDGRANNEFNGVNPAGPRTNARILEVTGALGTAAASVKLRLRNSALASQAVGPPLSDFEMTCAASDFRDKGRKMLDKRALKLQAVHPDDSVLGSLRHASGNGLTKRYRRMIKDAFAKRYWKDDGSTYADGYTMMETNFPFYWGIAIQLYEGTLISDDAPIDRVFDTDPPDYSQLTKSQKRGLDLFMDKAKCINCHNGPDLTSAGIGVSDENIERMLMGDNNAAVYDDGFYNIGVRPTLEDIGAGAKGPDGQPLSCARQAQLKAAGLIPSLIDRDCDDDPSQFEVNPGTPVSATERNAVDGAFKVPTLRNISLTGPYFHNGGTRRLKNVVRFYNRGGDRTGHFPSDSTGFNSGSAIGEGNNSTNLDPDITSLGLTSSEIRDLTAFLEAPMLDVRVKKEMAPFDHPALVIFEGDLDSDGDVDGKLDDIEVLLPAVGAGGRSHSGVTPGSVKGFLQ